MGKCCSKCCCGSNKKPSDTLEPTPVPEIRDDYIIGDKISDEKFAALHKCRKRKNGVKYDVKIFSVANIEKKVLKAFVEETKLITEADHPNIIEIIDIYKEPTKFFIITKRCKGGELLERIIQENRLSENKVAFYMQQIISSVVYLHSKNIIHRDLRLENFMFLSKRHDFNLKLVEFGSCKHFEQNVRVLERVGSPYFMSSEVINGNFDFKCDIWSLGVMMYILLSGLPPFVGDTESEIMQSIFSNELEFDGEAWQTISDDAKSLIRAMLNRNPEERPTAEQILSHAWIERRADSSVDDNIFENSTLSNLKDFYFKNKRKCVTLGFIVSQIIPSSKVENLKEEFEKIDLNGDGLLSEWQIRKTLASKTRFSDDDIEFLIAKVGIKNGKADYSDLLTLANDLNKEMTRGILIKAFNNLDADHSGKINKEELTAAFRWCHASSNIIEELINKADTDGDGEIDLDEFCNFAENFNNHDS